MKYPTHRPHLLSLGLALGLLSIAPRSTQAQTWDGGGTNNNWTTATNWLGDVAPVANDSLTFSQALRLAAANDFAAATQFNGLTFATSAGAFALTGNSVTLGGNIVNNSLNAQSSSNALVLNASRSVDVSQRNGALTLSGVISGSGFGITKTGNGLLTLSGANSFTGGLTLSAGTVNVGSFGLTGTPNAGAGVVSFDGGALRYSGGGNVSANVFAINTGKTATFDTGNGTGGGGTGFNYSGAIASTTGGLTKTGVGTLTLSGDNEYTGTTTVNQGTLALNFGASGGTTNTDIINSSSALVLGGGRTSLSTPTNVINGATLAVTGKAATVTSQTFNGVTLKQGVNAISVNNVGTSTTLALGAITQENGGFVNFTNTGGTISTTTANTNGIIGGFATIGGIASGNWAANDGSGNIVAYSGYLDYATGTNISALAGYTGTSNLRVTNGSTGNISVASGTTDINTIQSTDTAARTINIGAGNTLRLGAEGGIWKTQANGSALTISGGTLTAGGAANTAGEITLYANATNATTNSMVINSVIANNGTGAVALTKNGLGSVDINQANTFTGNVYINEGRLAGNNATSYGQNNTVYIQSGGQAFLSGGVTYANNFVISGITSVTDTASFGAIRVGNAVTTVGTSTSTITLAGDARIGRNNDTNIATLAGQLTGDFNLELTAAGQNTDANRNVFLLTNTGNDMGGNLGINAINLGAGQTAAANGNTSVQVRLGASEVIAHGAGKGNVYIGGSTTASNNSYLDLNGFNETINGLASVGTASQTRVTNGRSGTPGTATLTVGAGDATASFGGILENGTGTLALTKIGNGTQVLSGVNTYTGTTSVNAGTLLLSTAGSIANSVTVNVASGAVLDVTQVTGGSYTFGAGQLVKGSGTVAGNSVVQGNLQPGNSPGLLTFTGSLTLVSTTNTTMEVATGSRGIDYDGINGGSLLTYDGNLTLSMTSLVANTTYNLMDFGSQTGSFDSIVFSGGTYAGTFTESGGVWTATDTNGSGQSFSFDQATGDLTVVPEPSTVLLTGLGLGAVLFLRKRTRQLSA